MIECLVLTLNKKEINPTNKAKFSPYYFFVPEGNVHITSRVNFRVISRCADIFFTVQILVGFLPYNPHLASCFKLTFIPKGSHVEVISTDSITLTVWCLQI